MCVAVAHPPPPPVRPGTFHRAADGSLAYFVPHGAGPHLHTLVVHSWVGAGSRPLPTTAPGTLTPHVHSVPAGGAAVWDPRSIDRALSQGGARHRGAEKFLDHTRNDHSSGYKWSPPEAPIDSVFLGAAGLQT